MAWGADKPITYAAKASVGMLQVRSEKPDIGLQHLYVKVPKNPADVAKYASKLFCQHVDNLEVKLFLDGQVGTTISTSAHDVAGAGRGRKTYIAASCDRKGAGI